MKITYLKVETGRHLTYIFLTPKEWVVRPDRRKKPVNINACMI